MTSFDFVPPDSRYRGYIFDCDGTLVDSMPVHFRAWGETFRLHGARFAWTWELFVSRAGVGLGDTVRELNRQFGAALPVDAVVSDQLRLYETYAGEVVPIEPVASFARQAATWGRVSVASGGLSRHVRRSLRAAKLADLFPVVICQEDVRRGKPDPEMFLLAAARMDVAPEECLVVEDSPIGIAAATAAGMDSVQVTCRRDASGSIGAFRRDESVEPE